MNLLHYYFIVHPLFRIGITVFLVFSIIVLYTNYSQLTMPQKQPQLYLDFQLDAAFESTK